MACVEIVDTTDDKRPVLDAAVGDFADDHRCLERRDQLEALADSRVERIAEVPFIVEILLLIFRTGDQARCFAAQGDARFLAHAEHAGVFCQFVDADAAAHFVEVYVIGLGQGFDEVDPARASPPALRISTNQ